MKGIHGIVKERSVIEREEINDIYGGKVVRVRGKLRVRGRHNKREGGGGRTEREVWLVRLGYYGADKANFELR